MSGAVPVLYAGVMSCGVAYTLQIIGQRNLDPTVASLILSLESVVSVLAVLGDTEPDHELQGNFRLCPCLCSRNPGAASGKENGSRRRSQKSVSSLKKQQNKHDDNDGAGTIFAPFFTTIPEPMKLPRMEKRAAQSPNRRKTCPFIRKVTRVAILEARLMHLVFPGGGAHVHPGKTCEDQYQEGACPGTVKAVIGPDDKSRQRGDQKLFFQRKGRPLGIQRAFLRRTKKAVTGRTIKSIPFI